MKESLRGFVGATLVAIVLLSIMIHSIPPRKRVFVIRVNRLISNVVPTTMPILFSPVSALITSRPRLWLHGTMKEGRSLE